MSERPQNKEDFNFLMSTRQVPMLRGIGRMAVDAFRLFADPHRPPRASYIYSGARAFAQYCQSEKVQNIVLLDKSARPLWIGITEYWRRAYPRLPRPSIHFVNPAPLLDSIASSNSPGQLQERLVAAPTQFAKRHKASGLQRADRAAPLLLADMCTHTGHTLYAGRRMLQEGGFIDVRTGVISATLPAKSKWHPDVWVTDNMYSLGCRIGEINKEGVRAAPESLESVSIVGPAGVGAAVAGVRAYIASAIAVGWQQENARPQVSVSA